MKGPEIRIARILAKSVGLLAIAGGAALAAEPADLFQAWTIVTGQREETRLPGLQQCLRDVVIKVAGDPGIVGGRLARAG